MNAFKPYNMFLLTTISIEISFHSSIGNRYNSLIGSAPALFSNVDYVPREALTFCNL